MEEKYLCVDCIRCYGFFALYCVAKDDWCPTECEKCDDYKELTRMTNGDKIRSMSDEELWHFLDKVNADVCNVCSFQNDPLKCNRNCSLGFLNWCKEEYIE